MTEELNRSFVRLQEIDLDDFDDIVGSKASWIDMVKRELKVEVEENLKGSVFNSSYITKNKLATWTGDAREIMTRQADLVGRLQNICRAHEDGGIG